MITHNGMHNGMAWHKKGQEEGQNMAAADGGQHVSHSLGNGCRESACREEKKERGDGKG